MPDPSFVLTTLGELRLEAASGIVLPGRRKELLLLTYLARRAPKPVSRDELAALLWGERDEDKARQSLRQALHQLRQVLGEAIDVTSDKVRIVEGTVALDATLLEQDIAAARHVEAVARWNGEFLLGAEDAGDEDFRAWLERERESMRRSVVAGLTRLVAQARSEGRVEEEIRWANVWTSQFPLDEAAHIQHIDALRRKGDLDSARALHAAFVSRLKTELEGSPSVELIRLGERLARVSTRERQRQPGSGALHAPALVGRGAAIAASLIELWSRVRTDGNAVIIEGERGMGKSRQCAELIRRVGAGIPPPIILATRAEDGDAANDGSTLRRLLRGLMNAPALEDAPAKALAELAEAFPVLRERFPHLGPSSGRPDRLESAFRDLLRSVASRTSVLVILDDAGRADSHSVRLLMSLVTAIPMGTMIMFTLRSDEPSDAAIAKSLGELPAVRRFKLAPLSRLEIAELVDSMIEVAPTSRHRLVERLSEETGGNPHAVTALVSTMTDNGALTLNEGGVWQFATPVPPSVASLPADMVSSTSPAVPAESALGNVTWVRSSATRRAWVGAAIAVVVAVAAIFSVRQALKGDRQVTANVPPRVAVLDLELVTGDTLDSYLATGLTEEINASLARLEGLRLKSRGVVRTAQAKGLADPVQLGRDLQVDYLVEGALRRVGEQLKVTIRLTQATDGFQVWSEDFNADTTFPLLHDRVAREVAMRVGTHLGGVPATSRPLTTDARAYEHFLRGNYYLARRTPPTVQQAVAQYRTAVARDTTFGAAWARIAYAYALLLDWGWAHAGKSSEELFQEGLALATRAIELDSLSADAWMARAYLLETADPVHMKGAAEAFERAIRLDPRNAEAIHQYAQVHEALGNWDAAMPAFRRTLLLEPDRSLPYVAMASIAWKQGQPLLAKRLYDSALVVDPGASYVLSARALIRLFSLNDPAGGLEDAETAVRVNEGYAIPPHAVLAIALARTGSMARAELEVERALTEIVDPSSPSPTDARFVASALLAVGRRDEALSLLERVRPRGAWLWFYCLSVDFDPIRSDPRFVRVMAEAHPAPAGAEPRR